MVSYPLVRPCFSGGVHFWGHEILGGGFKYVLFSPLFGEDVQFDEHVIQMGGSTTNQFSKQ